MVHAVLAIVVASLTLLLSAHSHAQPTRTLSPLDPASLVLEAERLVWLKAWIPAQPLWASAERAYLAQGDVRGVLYARINQLRGTAHQRSAHDVTQVLATYLADPLVQRDDALRLRVLVIKGEIEQDVDPPAATRTWTAAQALAVALGEIGWATRARGELAVLAFLRGDLETSAKELAAALKDATAQGDIVSQIRWVTLWGVAHAHLGRFPRAIEAFDRAIALALATDQIPVPLLTYVGKGEALARAGRPDDAERVLHEALAHASRQGALGYQAAALGALAKVAEARGDRPRARAFLLDARAYAARAGAHRGLIEIAWDLARLARGQGDRAATATAIQDGLRLARDLRDPVWLPRLLAEAAHEHLAAGQTTIARAQLREAHDLLEGALARVSSPFVRAELIHQAATVYDAQIRLAARSAQPAGPMWTVVQHARARSLIEILRTRPLADRPPTPDAERVLQQMAEIERRLFRAADASERQRLLRALSAHEDVLAPLTTDLFPHARDRRPPLRLTDLQRVLRPDELLLEFAVLDPDAYCLVITQQHARVQVLSGRATLQNLVQTLRTQVQSRTDVEPAARALASALFRDIPELQRRARVIVSPDGALHSVPMDLLTPPGADRPLLDTHTLSYVPSGGILAILRARGAQRAGPRAALAVSASPPARPTEAHATTAGSLPDLAALPPLPAAADEARAVTRAFPEHSTLLIDATEDALTHVSLDSYRIIHIATHARVDPAPARSAFVLRPDLPQMSDGLWQAREILRRPMRADLVTLSACDTAGGVYYDQDGVAALLRPFLAAGARSVVAHVWAADDRFSATLMEAFYERLRDGHDVATALRHAKQTMIARYGPEAPPQLWSGILVYGDGAATVVDQHQRAPQ